jgi:hypothetical protein
MDKIFISIYYTEMKLAVWNVVKGNCCLTFTKIELVRVRLLL